MAAERATGMEPLVRILVLLICVVVGVAVAVGLFGGHFLLMEVVSYDDDWSPLTRNGILWLSLVVWPALGVWAGRQTREFAFKDRH